VAQLLVVEDDERIRSALIRALRERGHAVSSAATALAGLRQAVEVGAAVGEVLAPEATGWVAGEAEAPTSDTARKPSPTAAAADPAQAAARARVRFTGQSMQPNGLRPPQDGVKFGSASAGTPVAGVSVGPWRSCW